MMIMMMMTTMMTMMTIFTMMTMRQVEDVEVIILFSRNVRTVNIKVTIGTAIFDEATKVNYTYLSTYPPTYLPVYQRTNLPLSAVLLLYCKMMINLYISVKYHHFFCFFQVDVNYWMRRW
jgi:hypothetical protein